MDKTLIITRIIRPVVTSLIKLGCNFNLVKTIIQSEFINQTREFLSDNASRISTKTGIDRRIVKKILENQPLWLPTNGVDLVAEKLSEFDVEENISIAMLKAIIKSVANGRYTNTAVIDELVSTKRVSISDNKVVFLSTSLRGNFSINKYSYLLSDSIDMCHDTLWHLQQNNDLYYRWDFSHKIPPSDREAANIALFKLAKKHKDENLKCLMSFESTQETIYPKIGVLQVHFDYNH